MKEELCYAKINDLSGPLRAGQTSPVELVDACLARLGAVNPSLNAFITVLADDDDRSNS
jgi:aspartyl-tRNA(Asn)/glutamyl-tRNA(Gln) amidotransferase subunit A